MRIMQNQIKELNPQARLIASQISNSIYSKSYLAFILVLLVSIAFSAYCLSQTNNMTREMKLVQDRLEFNNAFVMKIAAKNEELIIENKKLKEER